MPARPVGRGRGAGACPWFEVDEGESEEGERLVRPGAAHPEPPGIGRDSWEGTLRQGTGRRTFKVIRGFAPQLKRAGIAPGRTVPESQRERGAASLRTPGVSTPSRTRARIFSPCDSQALEDVIPLGFGNSSSAPLASTPRSLLLNLFGDSVPLPMREVVAAVTPLPAVSRAGAPRGPAPHPGRLVGFWRLVELSGSLR